MNPLDPFFIKDLKNIIEDYDEPCERVPDILRRCLKGRYRPPDPLDSKRQLNCRKFCTKTFNKDGLLTQYVPRNVTLYKKLDSVTLKNMELIDYDEVDLDGAFIIYIFDITNAVISGDIDNIIPVNSHLKQAVPGFGQVARESLVERPESDLLVITSRLFVRRANF